VRSILGRAVSLHQMGMLAEAEQLYRDVLHIQPGNFDALHLLGVIHHQCGEHTQAVHQIDAALSVNPMVAAAHSNRAAALKALRQFDPALASYDNAIALKPDLADAFCGRGAVLNELGRFEEALSSSDRAVALRGDLAEAFNNRGNALAGLKRFAAALASFDRAIALKPNDPEAFNNRSNVLSQVRRLDEALASADRAISLAPDLAEAFYNRGIALGELERLDEALASYDRAIALKPDYPEALYNRGTMLLGLKRFDEATASYGKAVVLNPKIKHLKGMHLHAKMLLCNWNRFAEHCAELDAAITGGVAATSPFQLMAIPSRPERQLACAKLYVADRFPSSATPLWRGERYAHRRIRLAYLSADLRDHPVAYLIAGLFERHDRERFEVVGMSFARPTPGRLSDRLRASFDRFIDAYAMTDLDAATLLREVEIDIAVDLNGFTDGGRPHVLACRPVPVQINYLGYAGTLGAGYWDYILADRFVIPTDAKAHFAEQVVYLPDTFMVTDVGRTIAARTPSRSEAGLPENGFVFCCFNNSYKITPDVFDVWMRLLRAVEGSVLWLASANASATRNLQRQAEARGVAADRLVFAPKVPLNEDHLARLRLADLFLDTLYYNAHATAADALWAGVPVLTCAGETFASRVAGSLLGAIGLSELITHSTADYEALALKLARDPMLLAALRQKLAKNCEALPLFDTDRFTRSIEAAYTTMWQRAERGEPPQSFAVPITASPARPPNERLKVARVQP
jgi:protein O-GlcNAc transferase